MLSLLENPIASASSMPFYLMKVIIKRYRNGPLSAISHPPNTKWSASLKKRAASANDESTGYAKQLPSDTCPPLLSPWLWHMHFTTPRPTVVVIGSLCEQIKRTVSTDWEDITIDPSWE